MFGGMGEKHVPLLSLSKTPTMMEKLSPDILIEAYGLQLDEASRTGSKEELEALMKYAQKAVLRQLAPKLLEKEQEARARMDEREKMGRTKTGDTTDIFNLFNAPVGQMMGHVDKIENKKEDYGQG